MERLVIAEVLKPQGIRGELKVKTYTDFPEDVKEFGTVYISASKLNESIQEAIQEAAKVENPKASNKDKWERYEEAYFHEL